MRFIVAIVSSLLLTGISTAQNVDSNDLRTPLPQTTNPDALYRLFPTHNMYTMLELNTATGAISIIQWGFEDNKRFKRDFIAPPTTVSTENSQRGRFTLYPTVNIFTFVLLDQKTGAMWQFDWSHGGTFLVIPLGKAAE